jgi:hypothetical protein
VAETCRQHNKWDTRQLCFDEALPLSNCLLHKGHDAPKCVSYLVCSDVSVEPIVYIQGDNLIQLDAEANGKNKILLLCKEVGRTTVTLRMETVICCEAKQMHYTV